MGTQRKNTLKKEQKHARQQARIREGFQRAARFIGVEHLLAQFPHRWRQKLWDLPVGEPVIQLDPASAPDKHAPAILADLQRRLRQATLKLEDGTLYPLTDFSTFVVGLEMAFKWMLEGEICPRLKQIATEGYAKARAAYQRYGSDNFMGLFMEMRAGVAEHARMDRQLLSYTLGWQTMASGKLRTAIVFTIHPHREAQLEIDGRPRPAYRCGNQSVANQSLEWIAYPSSLLGLDGPERVYPLYIQSHALHRLEERLRPLSPQIAHFWMGQSLQYPQIASREGELYLIEFRFLEWKLGYFMARRIGSNLVITTFVFLTMQGTPEAELLRKKLQLHRGDIEYQGLDALITFLATDILDDPELLAIFQACGCGHLDEMRRQCPEGIGGYAADLRKFLRLDEAAQRQVLSKRLRVKLPALEESAPVAEAA